MSKKLFIIFSVILISAFNSLRAQIRIDTSYNSIRNIYNTCLEEANNNLTLLLKDSNYLKKYTKDSLSNKIKNINAYNEYKYLTTTNIEDTVSAKLLMMEEIVNLRYFNNNFNIGAGVPVYLENISTSYFINSKADEINWLSENKPWALQLEDCGECFFCRNIQVFVIQKKLGNKLDTLKCIAVDYFKKIPAVVLKSRSSLPSYPCDEGTKIVSTGKYYTFIVKIAGKEYPFENTEIPPGKSKNDLLSIPLVIPAK